VNVTLLRLEVGFEILFLEYDVYTVP